MRNRRGQAAMEFLMTYGWAILAAIIVVGVLWYIIGNPANLAGDKYLLSPPLSAGEKQVTTAGIIIEMRNSAGDSISISSIQIKNCGILDYTAAPVSHGDGVLTQYTVPCALTSGSRFKGDIAVNYTKGTSSLLQQGSGSISAKVP